MRFRRKRLEKKTHVDNFSLKKNSKRIYSKFIYLKGTKKPNKFVLNFFSKKNYVYECFSKRFLRKRIKFKTNIFFEKN